MNIKYFSIFFLVFLIVFSSFIFGSTLNFDPSRDYFYTESVDLGIKDLPTNSYYLTLTVSSQERVLFQSNFLAEEALSIPFKFETFFPSTLVVSYSFYSPYQELLGKEDYPLFLKQPPKTIDYFFCSDISCNEVLFDFYEENKDLYLVSTLKNSFFTIKITSQNFSKDYNNVSLPLKLNLQEGIYFFDVSTLIDNSLFKEKRILTILSETETKYNLPASPPLESSIYQPSQSLIQTLKSNSLVINLRNYWYILLIFLILLFLIFRKRKKKNTQPPKNSKKQLSRREARVKHFLFLLILTMFLSPFIFSETLTSAEQEFSYFTDDYSSLKKNFPQENEISLYITSEKKSNSYFFPIINHNNSSLFEEQTYSLKFGTLTYTPIKSLFAIDINKSVGSYAPFLPKQAYSSHCQPVLNYFKNYPVITKADLLNRNPNYLEHTIGFSSECISELMEKGWLKEKVVVSEIRFVPSNYSAQSKIVQADIFFKGGVLSKPLSLPINIIKTDAAIVYAYPDPVNYSVIKLETEENGWTLANWIKYPVSFSDMEEIYSLNLRQGEYGSYLFSLRNYNEEFIDFKVNFLDREKDLYFNKFISSDYFSYENENGNVMVIASLKNYKGTLFLDSYEIHDLKENSKKKLSISFNLNEDKKLVSKKNYSLYQKPSLEESALSFDLTSKSSVHSISKKDKYIFYNYNYDAPRLMDLYMIENVNDSYYLTENSADYKNRSNAFILENEHLKVKEIHSSDTATSLHILFKGETTPIIISTDRKGIASTSDPNFYVYKDYFIKFSSGFLKIYKNTYSYNNEKVNTYGTYDNTLFYLEGKPSLFRNKNTVVSSEKLKLFNSYVYDISNASYFSEIDQKVFWANTFKLADLEKTNWFADSNCNSIIYSPDINYYIDHFKKVNFTILKYPGINNFPFSMVSPVTKKYFIERNTFSNEKLSSLCGYLSNPDLSNYTYTLLNSANYSREKDDFIKQLSSFSSSITETYPDRKVYPARYRSELFISSKEGIIFVDENNNISSAAYLNFRNDYASSIDFLSNYLVFDRLAFISPKNLSFSKDEKENTRIKEYINNNFISPKDTLFLKFKLPKRIDSLTDKYIAKNFINDPEKKFSGNCTDLSLAVVGKYNYNNVRNFTENNDWWGSDFVREDAWFLAKVNQVVWNYRSSLPLNFDKLFEGLILGVYTNKTKYTYSANSTNKERAGKTYNDLLYTHTVPFIDKYNGGTGYFLNSHFFVEADNDRNYFSDNSRQLREVIVPKNYYDNTIKDMYGLTELDYVKAYLTSPN